MAVPHINLRKRYTANCVGGIAVDWGMNLRQWSMHQYVSVAATVFSILLSIQLSYYKSPKKTHRLKHYSDFHDDCSRVLQPTVWLPFVF